jgi:HEAT repeat protein
MTYGGFSDMPIDSPEPPKLDDSVVQQIVSALNVGLSDSHESVRASAAVAISWIGPRAKPAVPALVRLLDDPDPQVSKNVVSAIRAMGPEAKEALPELEQSLTHGDDHRRVNIAGAMRMNGAAPSTFVPALIDILSKEGPAHYAAMELAQLGDPAVPALLHAFKDKDSVSRGNAAYSIANMAGWEKLTKDQEKVADALIELSQDEDRTVVWHAVQAIGSVHAAPARSVPTLISFLNHPDPTIASNAVDALVEFGEEAKPALPSLIALLGSEKKSLGVGHAIFGIGVDRAVADAISKTTVNERDANWLLSPLYEYPEAAIEFLRRNPRAISGGPELINLLRSGDPTLKALQDEIYSSEFIPVIVMATLGESRFLPLIERNRKTASTHGKALWVACAVACGATPERSVDISESQPGDFKPKSAWPGTDASRIAPTPQGHGDGVTIVIVTGRILQSNGVPAAEPKFYRVNDSMLLGRGERTQATITYDSNTGRFVFVTSVFAAFSDGKGPRVPGPYQTGSSIVQIEAKGCKPLKVRFYDEMPDARITLSVFP